MNQQPGEPGIQARWNPIIVVGITAHGDQPVHVSPQRDGSALLQVGNNTVRCNDVRLALCAATGWVCGKMAVVTPPMEK